MKRAGLLATVGLPLLALALDTSPAAASGGEGSHAEGSHAMELVWQALNLAILLAALVYFARKPLLGFFADRRTRIRSELDDAASLLRDAESRYSEWQRKLIDLQREVDELRAAGRRNAEDERETILAESQAAAERIHRDASAAVEQELRRAQASLRKEAVELATEMAERILREKLVDNDRERLLDEFITRVGPAGR